MTRLSVLAAPPSGLALLLSTPALAQSADVQADQAAAVGDIVVTADIPLADRCLKSGAQALKSNGQPFTPDSIGSALAGRMVGEHLRSIGVATSGPPPFSNADRSRFLQALDTAVVRARKVSL